MSLEEIEALSLGLNDAERAWLAGRLLESLDGPPEGQVKKLWADEIERRVRDIDEGRCQLIPAEQVHQEILARFRR